ncbi:disulfide bond formation protein B [Methyloligella sp. 2.7D]|uniref:disulfide bond formation protein B n=1 Tax=unclassified Methyloligella TaxID=2625955 RepID=UPI00157C32A6|nr:disulfide bond formation protein B [Methyloligella sp. GL2]QKP76508.1 disulfide bond formation protein B [Methyloligella sp. GL2]
MNKILHKQWGRLGISSLVVSEIGLLTIIGALAFQYYGYAPCHLCLLERYAFYFGVPTAALAFALTALRPGFSRFLLLLVGLGFLINFGLSVYHVGVEWQWWAGPASCTGATDASDWRALAEQLKNTDVVRCDEPAVTVLGFSLAFWNGVVSLFLAGLAFYGAAAPKKDTEPYGSSSVSQ